MDATGTKYTKEINQRIGTNRFETKEDFKYQRSDNKEWTEIKHQALLEVSKKTKPLKY